MRSGCGREMILDPTPFRWRKRASARIIGNPKLVDPGSIDLSVEGTTLTISAERSVPQLENAEWVAAERPYGSYTRQLVLGRSLDTDRLEARHDNGVLTLTIPLVKAGPRRVEITRTGLADAA